jgi:hypothetical protein
MPPKNVPGYGGASADKTRSALGQWIGQYSGRRAAPVSGPAQTKFVLRDSYGGSTKRMAADYGVSQRTVERWIKGDRNPARSAAGRRVGRDVAKIRERRALRHAKAAVRRGQTPRVKMKAWIGPDASATADTETRRRRTITRDMDPDDALDLLDAYGRGDDAAAHEALERAYGSYFDRGATYDRADIGQVEWIEFE